LSSSGSGRGQIVDHRSKRRDLVAAGRRLYAAFEAQQAKIEVICPVLRQDLAKPVDTGLRWKVDGPPGDLEACTAAHSTAGCADPRAQRSRAMSRNCCLGHRTALVRHRNEIAFPATGAAERI